jgi:hypothetical protein
MQGKNDTLIGVEPPPSYFSTENNTTLANDEGIRIKSCSECCEFISDRFGKFWNETVGCCLFIRFYLLIKFITNFFIYLWFIIDPTYIGMINAGSARKCQLNIWNVLFFFPVVSLVSSLVMILAHIIIYPFAIILNIFTTGVQKETLTPYKWCLMCLDIAYLNILFVGCLKLFTCGFCCNCCCCSCDYNDSENSNPIYQIYEYYVKFEPNHPATINKVQSSIWTLKLRLRTKKDILNQLYALNPFSLITYSYDLDNYSPARGPFQALYKYPPFNVIPLFFNSLAFTISLIPSLVISSFFSFESMSPIRWTIGHFIVASLGLISFPYTIVFIWFPEKMKVIFGEYKLSLYWTHLSNSTNENNQAQHTQESEPSCVNFGQDTDPDFHNYACNIRSPWDIIHFVANLFHQLNPFALDFILLGQPSFIDWVGYIGLIVSYPQGVLLLSVGLIFMIGGFFIEMCVSGIPKARSPITWGFLWFITGLGCFLPGFNYYYIFKKKRNAYYNELYPPRV